jgi:hypothetical protein
MTEEAFETFFPKIVPDLKTAMHSICVEKAEQSRDSYGQALKEHQAGQ